MYASPEERAAGIERGPRMSAAELESWLAALRRRARRRRWIGCTDDQWATEVVTAQGRTVPATEIPWLRAREVYVHAVDLGLGVTFAELARRLPRRTLRGRRSETEQHARTGRQPAGHRHRSPLVASWGRRRSPSHGNPHRHSGRRPGRDRGLPDRQTARTQSDQQHRPTTAPPVAVKLAPVLAPLPDCRARSTRPSPDCPRLLRHGIDAFRTSLLGEFPVRSPDRRTSISGAGNVPISSARPHRPVGRRPYPAPTGVVTAEAKSGCTPSCASMMLTPT